MASKTLFWREYDGESIVDLAEDVMDAFDTRFNPVVGTIPADEYGILKGKFKLTLEWEPDEDGTETTNA